MKRFGIVISCVCIFVFAFAACGGGARTSIDAVAKYLSAAKGGASADDPVQLAVKIDLQNMSADASGWKQLLETINTAGKYVALDLSGCTMPGIEFSPDPAFDSGKKFIVSLVLPNSAESIAAGNERNSTFQHFVSLTNIPIGKSLTSIGGYAFHGNQLTSVTIPNSVTTIGDSAFGNNQLANVILPDSIVEIGRTAFAGNSFADGFEIEIDDDLKIIITKYNGTLKDVKIPESIIGLPVTAIRDGAFRNSQLTNVTLPSSIIEIGRTAFAGNSFAGGFEIEINNDSKIRITKYNGTLKDVKIPESIIGLPVTSIAGESKDQYGRTIHGAFYGYQLTSVTIPNTVTSIGDGAFYDNQLTSVIIPNSVTHLSGFSGNKLTSVSIPSSVTHLSGFSYNQLTSIIIPNSVTVIRDFAFAGNKLTSVIIPNNVTSIEEWAFFDSHLTSITIGSNVSIPDEAFKDYSITGVIPANGFAQYYNNGGKRAGTYTRSNTSSKVWTRQ